MSHALVPSEIATRIFDLLEDAKVALIGEDGSLFYGDQERLPTTPTVCVESGPTTRTLAGVPSRVMNEHECYILVYHSQVQSVELTKLQSEQVAEAITLYLDQNLTLERNLDTGIVIHGFVTRIDPGYSIKQGSLYKAVRLTWNGKTKTMLGA